MKNITTMEYRRGELFYYDFGENEGSIQCGYRPVMIIQADELNENAPTVVVAAITSAIKKRYLPSHVYLGKEFGLDRPSLVMMEQLRTVNKTDLQEYIGYVDDEKIWKVINVALKKTFGLWFYKKEPKKGAVRCLCPKCVRDYLANPAYRIRRVDLFAKVKDNCDKCNGLGYDYMVYDVRTAIGTEVGE